MTTTTTVGSGKYTYEMNVHWAKLPEVGVIRGPEVPRNIAFGGPDFRTVYTTPGESLYSFRVKTPGIKPY